MKTSEVMDWFKLRRQLKKLAICTSCRIRRAVMSMQMKNVGQPPRKLHGGTKLNANFHGNDIVCNIDSPIVTSNSALFSLTFTDPINWLANVFRFRSVIIVFVSTRLINLMNSWSDLWSTNTTSLFFRLRCLLLLSIRLLKFLLTILMKNKSFSFSDIMSLSGRFSFMLLITSELSNETFSNFSE